ncbi:MAG: cytochrome c oxidase assembly protein [Actinomycetota bacterium]
MIASVMFPSPVASRWTFDPLIVAPAVWAVSVYALGLRSGGMRAVGRARATSFFAGVAVALLSLVSPLHAASTVTFSAHMLQHQVLMLLAAPLIATGRPGLVMALAFSVGVRRVFARVAAAEPARSALHVLRNPLVILLVFTGVLWIWHLPGPYQAAVQNGEVHALEHGCFFAVAFAFWAGILRTGPRRRIRYVPSLLLVAGTMLLTGWLGAILTFGNLVYPVYAQRAAFLGLDAHLDQQLAGVIMWVPSTLIYLIAFGALFVRWFNELDLQAPRAPAQERAQLRAVIEP